MNENTHRTGQWSLWMARGMTVVASLLLGAGCATVIDGKMQKITIRSEPEGAEVYFMGEKVGTTPATISVKRIPNSQVTLRKAGRQDATLTLKATTNPNIWWNAVFCLTTYGVPSTLTDLANGSFYEYMPDTYLGTLAPVGTQTKADQQSSDSIRFITANRDHIMRDAAQGDGPHLAALCDLLEVQAERRHEAAVCIKGLASANGDAVDFARKVASALGTVPET